MTEGRDMREFEFESGNGCNKRDTRNSRAPSTWMLTDLKDAMKSHAKRFHVTRTLAVFGDVTGVDANHATVHQLPTRFYGPLIARYCQEMADRAHKVTT